MRNRILSRFLLGAMLLLPLLMCFPLGRWLSASAPAIRWKLGRTVSSLPPPPDYVTMLGRREVSDSGSDCSAFSIVEMYGTDHTFADVVQYYASRLTADRWRPKPASERALGEAVGWDRGRDESLELFTGRYVPLLGRGIPGISQDSIATYRTIYLLYITRSCGSSELEKP